MNLPQIHNPSADSLLYVLISRAPGKPLFILTTNNNKIFTHGVLAIFRQLTRYYSFIKGHKFWPSTEWLIMKVNIWLKAEAETEYRYHRLHFWDTEINLMFYQKSQYYCNFIFHNLHTNFRRLRECRENHLLALSHADYSGNYYTVQQQRVHLLNNKCSFSDEVNGGARYFWVCSVNMRCRWSVCCYQVVALFLPSNCNRLN